MNQKTAKKIRKNHNRLRREIDKELKLNVNEVMQIIKEEWSWKERLYLCWFLLFKRKGEIVL